MNGALQHGVSTGRVSEPTTTMRVGITWHNRLSRIGGNLPLGKNIDIVHDFKVVFISFKFYDCENCLHLRVSIINIMSFIFKAVCFDPFAA